MTWTIFDKAIRDKTIYFNPYKIYEHLLQNDPTSWSKEKQAWIITKHTDIKKVVSSEFVTTRRISIQSQFLEQDDFDAFNRFFDSWLLYKDGIDHLRLKRQTGKIIPPANLSILSGIEQLARSTLNSKKKQSRMDLVRDYSEIIAIKSIYNLFEVPSQSQDSIYGWSKHIVHFMQGRTESKNMMEQIGSTKIAIAAIQSAVENIYLKNRIYDSKVEYHEILGILLNVIIDGYEPISNSISNAVLALLNNPEQMRILREMNDITDDAIWELLRYDPPFQYIVRMAKSDFFINDVLIKKNERVLLMIAAANYDSDLYELPSRLNLLRRHDRVLSFGLGDHFCPGFNLAIPIIKLALKVLLEEIKEFNTDYLRISRYEALGSRALKRLPLSW